MKTLAIIPARGGSKRLPQKNILKLCGKPLFLHVFDAAFKSGCFDDIILTTDDADIAILGRKNGVDVPFLRPASLASDEARSEDVVRHAIHELELKREINYDFIMLLQPTSPFTCPRHIEAALDLLFSGTFDSVTSITKEAHAHPAYMLVRNEAGFCRLSEKYHEVGPHQNATEVFYRCGNIYAVKKDFFFKENSFLAGRIGYVFVEREYAVNIDDKWDWIYAEAVGAYLKSIKPEQVG